MDETKIKELFRVAEIAEQEYDRVRMQNYSVNFKERIEQDIAYEKARFKAIEARKTLMFELDNI